MGGCDPFTTTPLLSLHLRLPKKNSTANKTRRHTAPATLMPATAPFDRPVVLPSLAGTDVLVGVTMELKLAVEGVPVTLTIGPIVVSVVRVVLFVTVLVAVLAGRIVSNENISALAVLLDSSAANRFLVGQPSSLPQASLEQQPKNGISKPEQVYQ